MGGKIKYVIRDIRKFFRNRYDCHQTRKTRFDLFELSILNGAYKIIANTFLIARNSQNHLTTPNAFPILETRCARITINLIMNEVFSFVM